MLKKKSGKVAVLFFGIGLMLILMTGCTTLKSDEAKPVASTPAVSKKAETVYHDFGDVLIPKTLTVNSKDSFVMHSAGTTSGVLVLSGRVEANSLVGFFENNMQRDGWRKTGAFRSERSLILFNKENRWCVIGITEGRLRTDVEIWVAPTLNEAGMPLTR